MNSLIMLMFVSLGVAVVWCFPPCQHYHASPSFNSHRHPTHLDQADSTSEYLDKSGEHVKAGQGNSDGQEDEAEWHPSEEPEEEETYEDEYNWSHETDYDGDESTNYSNDNRDDDNNYDGDDDSYNDCEWPNCEINDSDRSEEEPDVTDEEIVRLVHDSVLSLLEDVKPAEEQDQNKLEESYKVVVSSAEHAIEDLLKVLVLIKKYFTPATPIDILVV